MADLFDPAIFSVQETSGAIGVGWKLYFYQTGTTTLQNTYPTDTDADAATNANTNPLVSDAGGRFSSAWFTTEKIKVVLKDASDVTKATRDPAEYGLKNALISTTAGRGAALVKLETGETLQAIGTIVKNLSSADSDKGAALVGFKQAGSGAVDRTVLAKARERVSVEDFGAVGDGTTDDQAAIAAAITAAAGGEVLFDQKTYRITSALGVIPDNTKLRGAGKFATVIYSDFSGDLMTLGDGCTISDMTLDQGLNDANTGKGINILDADDAQTIENCRIIHFDEYCIDFEIHGGSRIHVINCDIWRRAAAPGSVATHGSGRYAVRVADSLSNEGTPRHFINCQFGACPSYDFGGAENFHIVGGTAFDCLFSDNSRNVNFTGSCRIAGTTALTLKGSGTMVGCDCFPDITLSTDTAWTLGPGLFQGTITDSSNAADDNMIFSSQTFTWTPTIAFGGAAITLGSGGSIAGAYQRIGKTLVCTVRVLFGTGPTIGTGALTISLPATSEPNTAQQDIAIGNITDTAGAYYAVKGIIGTAATTMTLGVLGQAIAAGNYSVTHANPGTIGTGSALWIGFTYFI